MALKYPLVQSSGQIEQLQAADDIIGAALGMVPGGRLTTETGVPVSISDRTGSNAATIYYTPYLSDYLRLYDGTRVREYSFTERSWSVSVGTASRNYDLFLYDNAGTLTLEPSAAWNSDNVTRTDALAWQSGLGWVKSGSPTRLWLGTIRAATTTQTEDSAAKRFVWNNYNPEPRRLQRDDTTSHTYSSATERFWNGDNTQFIGFVCGQTTTVQWGVTAQHSGGTYGWVGVQVDWTTGSISATTPVAYWGSATDQYLGNADFGTVAAGYHTLPVIQSASGSRTFSKYHLAGLING